MVQGIVVAVQSEAFCGSRQLFIGMVLYYK